MAKEALFFNGSVDGCPSFLDLSPVVKNGDKQRDLFDTLPSTVLRVSYHLLTAREDSTSIGNDMRSKLDHV